jgi:hypothetical protein
MRNKQDDTAAGNPLKTRNRGRLTAGRRSLNYRFVSSTCRTGDQLSAECCGARKRGEEEAEQGRLNAGNQTTNTMVEAQGTQSTMESSGLPSMRRTLSGNHCRHKACPYQGVGMDQGLHPAASTIRYAVRPPANRMGLSASFTSSSGIPYRDLAPALPRRGVFFVPSLAWVRLGKSGSPGRLERPRVAHGPHH